MKQYIIMKRVSENANLSSKFANGDWQKDSQYYLMDRFGFEFPILKYYSAASDEIEYFCDNTPTSAYESIRKFVDENNDRNDAIMNISNPFNLEF